MHTHRIHYVPVQPSGRYDEGRNVGNGLLLNIYYYVMNKGYSDRFCDSISAWFLPHRARDLCILYKRWLKRKYRILDVQSYLMSFQRKRPVTVAITHDFKVINKHTYEAIIILKERRGARGGGKRHSLHTFFERLKSGARLYGNLAMLTIVSYKMPYASLQEFSVPWPLPVLVEFANATPTTYNYMFNDHIVLL